MILGYWSNTENWNISNIKSGDENYESDLNLITDYGFLGYNFYWLASRNSYFLDTYRMQNAIRFVDIYSGEADSILLFSFNQPDYYHNGIGETMRCKTYCYCKCCINRKCIFKQQ